MKLAVVGGQLELRGWWEGCGQPCPLSDGARQALGEVRTESVSGPVSLLTAVKLVEEAYGAVQRESARAWLAGWHEHAEKYEEKGRFLRQLLGEIGVALRESPGVTATRYRWRHPRLVALSVSCGYSRASEALTELELRGRLPDGFHLAPRHEGDGLHAIVGDLTDDEAHRLATERPDVFGLPVRRASAIGWAPVEIERKDSDVSTQLCHVDAGRADGERG